MITVFPGGATDTTNAIHESPECAINAIRSPRWLGDVHAVRDAGPTEADEIKRGMPVICWSGTFRTRRNADLIDYSGLVCLDYDDVEDPGGMRGSLRELPWVWGAFISPSGRGVKVIARVASPAAFHVNAWHAAATEIAAFCGEEADPSGKDVARACFVSHDPDAWCNLDATALDVPQNAIPEPEKPAEARDEAPAIGGRHEWLVAHAARLAATGMPRGAADAAMCALQAMANNRGGRLIGNDEVGRIIESAYRKFSVPDQAEMVVHGGMVARELLAGIPEDTDAAPPIHEPWPTDLLKWPGMIGACMKDMEQAATYWQPALGLGGCLAVLGSVFGRLVAGPTDLRTNLYCVGLAETGCGKETPRAYFKRLMRDAGGMDHLHAEAIASETAVISAAMAKPSATFLIDEIGRMMAACNGTKSSSHERGILTALLTLFTSAASVYTGKAYADTKNRPAVEIDQPCVGVFAVGNGEEFWSNLSTGDITNGFLPRVLVFEPDEMLPPFKTPAPMRADEGLANIIGRWRSLRSGLNEFCPDPHVVPYAPGVAETWAAFQRDIHERRKENGPLMEREMLTRVWEKANKVALIRACARSEPEALRDITITRDDTDHAIELVRYLHRRAMTSVVRNVGDSQYQLQLKKVLNYIMSGREGGKAMRDVARFCQRVPRHLREDIMGNLTEGGQVIVTARNNRRVCLAATYATEEDKV